MSRLVVRATASKSWILAVLASLKLTLGDLDRVTACFGNSLEIGCNPEIKKILMKAWHYLQVSSEIIGQHRNLSSEMSEGAKPSVSVMEGKNSLAPMRAAIAVLRARAGLQRPIFVYHTDLPANDFKSLFEVLESDPDSYVRGRAERLSWRNRAVILSERSATELRRSRVEFLRRSVAEPNSVPDTGSFLHSVQYRCGARRVRRKSRHLALR